MLQPARRKYRKEQKGRNTGLATRGTKVSFGEYGLKATARGRLTARQIEAARRAMTRHIKRGGRIVCVSSISGIAGNMGQTNYAVSKAGVIGMVHSMAPRLREHAIAINAVAPGFIETQMTDAIPFTIRTAARLMNSMNQGGQTVDVAETIAWFACPASAGITGNIVRVCGQSMIGA